MTRSRRTHLRPFPGGDLALLLGVLLAGATLLLPPSAAGQLLTRGDLEGVVRSGGLPVAAANVTLMPSGGGIIGEQLPPRDGRFAFRALVPGSYDLRIEAVGYRPLLVLGVALSPGRVVRVPVDLTPEAPPVTRVDTTQVLSGGADRSAPGLLDWISGSSADELPDRDRQTAGLNRLVPSRLGPNAEGLPAGSTLAALDGMLLRPAMRTAGGNADPDGSFPYPRNGLSGVAVLGAGEDPEWGLAPGGLVALFPAPGGAGLGVGLWGAGSAGGLWSSGLFPGEVPSSTSFWGGGHAGFSLDGERGRGMVAAEFRRTQAPRPPALAPGPLESLLARSDLPGAAAGLAAAGLDETTALSAVTRVDWGGADGRGGGITVAFGRSETTGTPTGSGYLPVGERGVGIRADLAASANYLYPVGDRVRVEGRVGVHRSERDPGAGETPAGALLVHEGGALGVPVGFPVRVQRSTAVATGIIHFQDGNQVVKGGIEGRFSSHEREGLPGMAGEFAFAGLAGMAQGRGASTVTLPGTTVAEFTVPAYGLFVRAGWTPRPGFELTAGVRRDVEFLPASDITVDSRWFALTRLASVLPSSVGSFSGSGGFSWDPAADGRTVIRASAGLHHGEMDPSLLADLIQMDGEANSSIRRTLGGASGWPAAPGSGSQGILLSLPGPEVKPTLSIRGSGGVLRRVGEGSTLQLQGVFRRTEGMVRVADVNRIPFPRAEMSGVRPFFGTPGKEGGVVGPEPGSNRLFPAYDRVWAQNADGWSEYLGVGGSFDHAAPGWGFRASYLFSRTEDNLPGLLSGGTGAGLDPFPGQEVDWREGRSDLDLPHRASVEGHLSAPGRESIRLSAVYTFRSGLPFTAGFRSGVDMNGDGSWNNDPAVLTGAPDATALLGLWGCEQPAVGGIVPRNGCRGPAVHGLDLGLSFGGIPLGGANLALTVEALGILESEDGVRDTALYLVDPAADLTLGADGTLTVPLLANQDFGTVLRGFVPGRQLRIGVRLTR